MAYELGWALGGRDMDKTITQTLEEAFYPHHCGVEFLPIEETYKTGIGLRVSDKDEKLPPFERKAGRDAVEHDLDQVIADWKDEAIKAGFRF